MNTGLFVYMVFQSFFLLQGLRNETPRRRTFYIYYGFTQLFFVTVRSTLHAITGQLVWIEHRDVPGGPSAYYSTIGGNWYGISSVTCTVISFALTDGLLVNFKSGLSFKTLILILGPLTVTAISLLCHLEHQLACCRASFCPLLGRTR